MVAIVTVAEQATETKFTINQELKSGTRYYWRVRAFRFQRHQYMVADPELRHAQRDDGTAVARASAVGAAGRRLAEDRGRGGGLGHEQIPRQAGGRREPVAAPDQHGVPARIG